MEDLEEGLVAVVQETESIGSFFRKEHECPLTPEGWIFREGLKASRGALEF